MVIREEKPITIAEVIEMAGNSDKAEEIKKFLNGFYPVSLKRALELREEINSLKILKLKEEHIVKIIDFMPGEITELNKILSDVSLDSEEANKILDVVGKL